MILGLLFILSSVMMYLELIQPAYENAQQTKARKNSLQTFIDSEKTVVERIQKLINSYKGEGQVQQAVSEVLPIEKDVAGALAQLYGLAQNNGLSAKAFTISAVPALKKRGASNAAPGIPEASSFETALQKQVGALSFGLQLSGSYENLKNLLSALETNIRIFDVATIDVQPVLSTATAKSVSAGMPTDSFNYSITVNTYYQSQQ